MISEFWIRDFAGLYTAAWCSRDAARVAALYAPEGSLMINRGSAAVGRVAIIGVVQGFMAAFPDLQVLLDDVIVEDQGALYHWTLRGTNSGPGGTGHRVCISGYERWRIGQDGLIAESQGHFDDSVYQYQLLHGVESQR